MASRLGFIEPFELERYFAKYEFNVQYMLSCSDCEAYTLPELLALADDDCLKRWKQLSLGYTESQGLPELRQEVSKRLYTRVSPNDLIVVSPQEGILLAMNAVLQEGDYVLCTAPGYQSLYSIATAIGCHVLQWDADQPGTEEDGWTFSLHRVKQVMKEHGNKLKMIIFNFPHNPTGALPSTAFVIELMKLARGNNSFVFSDEMYRLLEYDPNDRLPSISDLSVNAISLFGMSKSFGMPGLRIGWLATRNKHIMDRIRQQRDYTTICCSAPSEILALIGVRAIDHIVKRNLAIIQDNLVVVEHFFQKFQDVFSWSKPKAGSICFPRFRRDDLSISAFCEDVREFCDTLILPSSVYGYGDKHFRLGFGRVNFIEALGRLEQYMEERFPVFEQEQATLSVIALKEHSQLTLNAPRLWLEDKDRLEDPQDITADFIQSLKEIYGISSPVFGDYAALLRAWKDKRISIEEVFANVQTLFDGHEDLIQRFHTLIFAQPKNKATSFSRPKRTSSSEAASAASAAAVAAAAATAAAAAEADAAAVAAAVAAATAAAAKPPLAQVFIEDRHTQKSSGQQPQPQQQQQKSSARGNRAGTPSTDVPDTYRRRKEAAALAAKEKEKEKEDVVDDYGDDFAADAFVSSSPSSSSSTNKKPSKASKSVTIAAPPPAVKTSKRQQQQQQQQQQQRQRVGRVGEMEASEDMMREINFDDCVNYINKVRQRFGDDDNRTYECFLGCLRAYQQDGDIPRVRKRIHKLFRGHADLLEEFKIYLPQNVTL